MLSVNNLAKSFADQLVFQDVSFVVSPGERVGLLGPNGCGKTTLLRIIAGEEKPDRGNVFVDPHVRLGYLRQGLAYPIGCTLAAALAMRDPRLDAAAEVERLAGVVATQPDRLVEYQRALDRLEALGGYPDPSTCDNVLKHLGLDQVPLAQEVATLSGGQKTRLGLAQVLLTAPTLLLLDEPTNHLDLPMLEWLEDWLSDFRGAVLLVSHDRVFLDRSINRVLYLDPLTHTLREYVGNYSAYLEQSLVEREKQWAEYRDQQDEIRRMQQDIARMKARAAKSEWSASSVKRGGERMKLKGFKDYTQSIARGVAKKAKSREKKLERYVEADERVEKPRQLWQLKVDFGDLPESGKDVLRLDKVSVGYGERVLLHDVTLSMRQGERIALIGKNGTGKSTLIKTIGGQLRPLAGEVRLGVNVRVGYFAQEQDVLDPASTPLTTLQAIVPWSETELRGFLHRFLFAGDQPLMPNHLLSYGERARLMLAQLVVQGCNFLILDEPINHLDIPSRTQFEQALASFEGTALAVVHDRYFIQGFASRIWAVQADRVREYFDLAAAGQALDQLMLQEAAFVGSE
ncbi:putative ABC transporter ATP-binding protein YheS [Thermoflexales bacterium]|nr:putative ABC transporter ATP-binding protein YheS [Thermoflexales bacterium]